MLESKGNKSWLERSPKWVQVSVSLLLVPLWGPLIIFVVLLFALIIPFFFVTGYFKNRAFWNRLKKRGLVEDWPQLANELSNGFSTLVVLTYKGPRFAILINQPRLTFDPTQRLPTWFDIESKKWKMTQDKEENLRIRSQLQEILKTQSDIEQQLLKLLKTEGCYKVSPVTTSQLNELSSVAKQQYVVVLWNRFESDIIGNFLEMVSKALPT